MKQIIELGETIRLYLQYVDPKTNTAVDPTTLTCNIRRPDNTILTITYPETNFVREAAGQYYIRMTSAQLGTHSYSIIANVGGSDYDVRSGKFDVEPAV